MTTPSSRSVQAEVMDHVSSAMSRSWKIFGESIAEQGKIGRILSIFKGRICRMIRASDEARHN
ncbi:MAG: hypothetical protein H7A36_06100 [Chlamydiales bacterium]|nr:hypothetical protein [Chlamydiales bacterium]